MTEVSPFIFVDAINHTKKDLIREGAANEADYNAFLTNRALSYFNETIWEAQDMNMH